MVHRQDWERSLFDNAPGLDGSELLFHYTSVERAAAMALTQSMLLSPLSVLNDPREAQTRGTTMVTYTVLGEEEPDLDGLADDHEAEVRRLRAQVRIACFTMDARNGSNTMLADRDSRGFARPRMWAQYGDGNRGCCIVLNRQSIISAAQSRADHSKRRVKSGAVTYVQGFDHLLHEAETADFNDPLTGVPGSDPSAQHDRVIDSLFSKNADWAAEREFRVVVDGWDNGDPCVIPLEGCVLGIAFGTAFQAHHLPIAEAIRSRFELNDTMLALMSVAYGSLVAFPLVGPDGKAHRWAENELRRFGTVFDDF